MDKKQLHLGIVTNLPCDVYGSSNNITIGNTWFDYVPPSRNTGFFQGRSGAMMPPYIDFLDIFYGDPYDPVADGYFESDYGWKYVDDVISELDTIEHMPLVWDTNTKKYKVFGLNFHYWTCNDPCTPASESTVISDYNSIPYWEWNTNEYDLGDTHVVPEYRWTIDGKGAGVFVWDTGGDGCFDIGAGYNVGRAEILELPKIPSTNVTVSSWGRATRGVYSNYYAWDSPWEEGVWTNIVHPWEGDTNASLVFCSGFTNFGSIVLSDTDSMPLPWPTNVFDNIIYTDHDQSAGFSICFPVTLLKYDFEYD